MNLLKNVVDILPGFRIVLPVARRNTPNQTKPNTTMNGNKFADKVQSATLEDAIKWEATEEKTMFCVEFLEAASVNQIDSFWQEELEDKFEALLAAR